MGLTMIGVGVGVGEGVGYSVGTYVAVESNGWKAVAVIVDPAGALRIFSLNILLGDSDGPLRKFSPRMTTPRMISVMISSK